MGVDRGIHVEISGAEYDTLQPIHVSKILAKLAQDEKADIIIVGKQVSEQFYFVTLWTHLLQTLAGWYHSFSITTRHMTWHFLHIHLVLIWSIRYLIDSGSNGKHKGMPELSIFVLGFSIRKVESSVFSVWDFVVEEKVQGAADK